MYRPLRREQQNATQWFTRTDWTDTHRRRSSGVEDHLRKMHLPLRREQQTTQTRHTRSDWCKTRNHARITSREEKPRAEKRNQSRKEPKRSQKTNSKLCVRKRGTMRRQSKMGRIAQDQQKTQEGHMRRTQCTCDRCREEVVEWAKERELTRKMPTERTTKSQRNKSEEREGGNTAWDRQESSKMVNYYIWEARDKQSR